MSTFGLQRLVGFCLCWYVVFVVVYAAVVSVSHSRLVVFDKLVAATLYLVGAIIALALGSTIIYVFHEGWQALRHVNFYTHDMAGVSPRHL